MYTYQALYAVIGTTYGGDGKNTFALPDLRGRVPVHLDNVNGYAIGSAGGAEAVKLTVDQIPPHSHSVRVSASAGTVTVATGGYPAAAAAPASPTPTPSLYGAAAQLTTLNPATVENAGGGLAHNNIQPSLVMGFLIATTGTFPTRS